MKTSQILSKSLLITLFLIGATLTSCMKSEIESDRQEDEKIFGTTHNFDITLVNNATNSETIKFSGTVPIDDGNALYRNKSVSGISDHSITLILGKLDEAGSVFGILNLKEDKQPITELKDVVGQKGGLITIRPKGTEDYFTSTSGTLKVSDLMYALPTLSSGAASFKLEFDGVFEKNNKEDQTYKGSGTITIIPEKAMGSYKKP